MGNNETMSTLRNPPIDGNGRNIHPDFHPVQTNEFVRNPHIPADVALRAYEVYCHVFHPQEAMVTGGCRGGFSVGEIISFLYARSFPKEEWSRRVDEAIRTPPR